MRLLNAPKMKSLSHILPLTALACCASLNLSSCAQAQEKPAKKADIKKPKAQTVAAQTKDDGVVTIPGLSVALDVGSPLFILQFGDENKAALEIKNTTAKAQGVTMQVEIESFDGTKRSAKAELEVPAKGTAKWPIPRALLGELGIKYVRATLQSGGVAASPVGLSLAYIKPTGQRENRPDDFIFGIAYGSSPDETRAPVADALSLIGVAAVRTNPNWPSTNRKPDEWNWERADTRLKLNTSRGMETQWLILGTPPWAVVPEYKEKEGRDYVKPPQPEAWRNFVRAMANRYNDKARYWEIWNEPDIGFFKGTVPQYLEMQRIAYEEIKKADPKQIVLSGGFTSSGHREVKKGMVEGALREGNFDVLAYHQHGPFDKFQNEIDGYVLPLMKQTGREKMPLYFTETAMDTRYGERHQAETLVKKLTFAWSRGAIGYTWFNMHDFSRGTSPTQPGQTYGLYTKNGNPKAVYPTYNTLIGVLRGKKFIKQYELPGNQWAFLFAGGGEQVVVAWNESSSVAGSQLVLRSDATQIESVDLMGNRSGALVAGDKTLWPVENGPRYLVLRGAKSEPTLQDSLVEVSQRFVMVPGQKLSVSTRLSNPLQEARVYNLTWKLPTEFGGQTIEKKVTVAAGASQTAAIEVPIPADYNSRFGTLANVQLGYAMADTPFAGTLKIPLEMGALVVPRAYTDKPTFVLDDQEQVTNLTEADPSTEHLLWRDPNDLSARVSLSHADGALKIRVAVRDDIFFQDGSMGFWNGDGIRLALQLPEQARPFELTLADDKGVPRVSVNEAPSGMKPNEFESTLQIERDGANRTYELTIPDAQLGATPAQLASGIRFNLLVNDNDARGLKGYIAVAPGIGNNFDATQFPLLVVKDR